MSRYRSDFAYAGRESLMLADGAMLDIEATIELPPDADWPADCGVRAAIDGVRVGRAHFVHGGSGFDLWTTPISWEATGDPGVEVEPAHRRRGIATAMYRFAHRFLPGGIRPSGDLTDDGRAYWAKLWCDPIFGD